MGRHKRYLMDVQNEGGVVEAPFGQCPNERRFFMASLSLLALIVFVKVSKSCNLAITLLRKIFENLCKILTIERETGITGPNFIYLSQFHQVFLNLHIFYIIFNGIVFKYSGKQS